MLLYFKPLYLTNELLRREDESGCNAAEVLCVCVCVRSTKQREGERKSLRQSFNVKGDNTSTN